MRLRRHLKTSSQRCRNPRLTFDWGIKMKRKILPYGSLLKRVFGKYVPKKQDKQNSKRAVKKSERQAVRAFIRDEVLSYA